MGLHNEVPTLPGRYPEKEKLLVSITMLSVDAVFFYGTMHLCNGMKSFGNAA